VAADRCDGALAIQSVRLRYLPPSPNSPPSEGSTGFARGQFRQPDPIPRPIQQLGSHPQPQPGLAGPGPGQRDQERLYGA
jgi:hypothetical protein